MFSLNEKVVYPGHGVATVNRIVTKKIAGSTTSLIELKFLNNNMIVLVPTNNIASVGIRKISSDENIETIFKILSEPVKKMFNEAGVNTWARRNRDYQYKLKTGNIREICKIYRDLRYIAAQKELSFGERNILHQSENLLAQEISIVKNVDEEQAIEYVRLLCKPSLEPKMI